MLAIIAIIIILLWLGGFAFHIGAGLIHILLVVGIIMLLLHFIRGGRGGV